MRESRRLTSSANQQGWTALPTRSLPLAGCGGSAKIARTLAFRVSPSNGLGRNGMLAFWLTISLMSAPDITNTLIPGRSWIRCAHRSVPFSLGICTSVITKSMGPGYETVI